MRRLICLLATLIVLAVPSVAFAADWKLNINVSHLADGTTYGELLIDNKVVWRLEVLADGARPVTGGSRSNTTIIAPDIVNGMLKIKLSHSQE